MDCAHIDLQHPAPPGPELAPQLSAALERAEAEQYAGRLGRAEEAARRALKIAERSGVPAATAAARHSLGRVLGHQRLPDQALTLLDAAAREATRAGHDTVRIDALLFAAKTRILDLGALVRAEKDADDADDFIARLDVTGVDTTRQTAELHEVRGFLAEKRKDLAGALDHFGHALRLHRQRSGGNGSRVHTPCPDIGLDLGISATASLDELRTLHNLALALGDLGGERNAACVEALYRNLLEISEATLGPLGPLPLDIRYNLAVHLNDAERHAEALEVLGTSAVASRVQYGDRSIVVADVFLVLGQFAADAGDMQAGQRWAKESAERYAEACVDGEGCPPNYGVALALRGETVVDRDPARAVGFYRAAIAALASIEEAAEHHADAMLGLTDALIELGNLREARAEFERASEQFHRQGRGADPGLLAIRERLESSPPTR